MKRLFFIITIIISGGYPLSSQTLQEARKMYTDGDYIGALPVFEAQYKAKPNDASINHWYGVSLYMTGGDTDIAEECLQQAAKRKIYEANMYLGAIYTDRFDFEKAEEHFDVYETYLNRKGSRTKAQREQEETASEKLAGYKTTMQQLRRMVSHTEDVQIIDSIIVDKDNFLSAYALSFSGGRIAPFAEIFEANMPVNSTVFINEKETKMYYAQPGDLGKYSLFTMEHLIDHYGNERLISKDNFELTGNLNYPFVMADGVTIYFAAEDDENIGGYDLFVTRYNLNNDSYLKPERLNMPFNSRANDYMMVVDEEKGVGWFATDRGMDEGFVCVYTFIPNNVVKIIQSEDNRFLADRARITSIKDTWTEGVDYSKIIAEARSKPEQKEKIRKDFEFVINDRATYYTLQDFKNIAARDSYNRVVQMKSELSSIAEKLETERNNFINAPENNKKALANTIQQLENRQRKLWKEIPEMEMKARNLEMK